VNFVQHCKAKFETIYWQKEQKHLSTMETENRAEEERPNNCGLKSEFGYSRLLQVTMKLSLACRPSKLN
jgi:hypothetical protein